MYLLFIKELDPLLKQIMGKYLIPIISNSNRKNEDIVEKHRES